MCTTAPGAGEMFDILPALDRMHDALNEGERKQLDSQHRGSINKDKGTDYERYYAAYSIIAAAFEYRRDLENRVDPSRHIFDHTRKMHVDDLVTITPRGVIFVQAKDWETLSWGKVNRHFLTQLRLNAAAGLTPYSTVALVVSRKDVRDKLLKEQKDLTLHNLPLKDVEIWLFENNTSDFEAYGHAFLALSAGTEYLRYFKDVMYAAFLHTGFCGTLHEVFEHAHILSHGAVSDLESTNYVMSDNIEKALKSIEGLKDAWVVGSFLYFEDATGFQSVLDFRCESPAWKSFENYLLNSPPADIIALVRIVGGKRDHDQFPA